MTKRQRALALVSQYYADFNAGRRPEMMALLASDVIHDINQGGAQIGREAFIRFMLHMDECYAEQVAELVLMADDSGTRVAAEFFILGRYLRTDKGLPEAKGQTYRLRVGAFFEVDSGEIRRVTNYYNLQDWLAQVGSAKAEA